MRCLRLFVFLSTFFYSNCSFAISDVWEETFGQGWQEYYISNEKNSLTISCNFGGSFNCNVEVSEHFLSLITHDKGKNIELFQELGHIVSFLIDGQVFNFDIANYPLTRSVFLFSADQFSILSRPSDLLYSDHSLAPTTFTQCQHVADVHAVEVAMKTYEDFISSGLDKGSEVAASLIADNQRRQREKVQQEGRPTDSWYDRYRKNPQKNNKTIEEINQETIKKFGHLI